MVHPWEPFDSTTAPSPQLVVDPSYQAPSAASSAACGIFATKRTATAAFPRSASASARQPVPHADLKQVVSGNQTAVSFFASSGDSISAATGGSTATAAATSDRVSSIFRSPSISLASCCSPSFFSPSQTRAALRDSGVAAFDRPSDGADCAQCAGSHHQLLQRKLSSGDRPPCRHYCGNDDQDDDCSFTSNPLRGDPLRVDPLISSEWRLVRQGSGATGSGAGSLWDGGGSTVTGMGQGCSGAWHSQTGGSVSSQLGVSSQHGESSQHGVSSQHGGRESPSFFTPCDRQTSRSPALRFGVDDFLLQQQKQHHHQQQQEVHSHWDHCALDTLQKHVTFTWYHAAAASTGTCPVTNAVNGHCRVVSWGGNETDAPGRGGDDEGGEDASRCSPNCSQLNLKRLEVSLKYALPLSVVSGPSLLCDSSAAASIGQQQQQISPATSSAASPASSLAQANYPSAKPHPEAGAEPGRTHNEPRDSAKSREGSGSAFTNMDLSCTARRSCSAEKSSTGGLAQGFCNSPSGNSTLFARSSGRLWGVARSRAKSLVSGSLPLTRGVAGSRSAEDMSLIMPVQSIFSGRWVTVTPLSQVTSTSTCTSPGNNISNISTSPGKNISETSNSLGNNISTSSRNSSRRSVYKTAMNNSSGSGVRCSKVCRITAMLSRARNACRKPMSE